MEFWKSEKSARILRSSGFWNFFRIWKIPLVSTSKVNEKSRHFWRLGAHTAQHSFRRKKLRHFTWPVRVLTSGILQIRKKFQNPEIPRILALFSDLRNSTFKYPYRPWEVVPFCHLGAPTHIRTAAIRKNRNTLHVILGYLEVEFCKSEKVPES